jgi:hypothetical protein
MKIRSTLRTISSVGLFGLLLATGHALAVTWDCSGTKNTTKETISSQTIKPGDHPGRELVQVERIDIISSDDPELDGIENTVYLHLDHLGATGDNKGYSVWHLNSGEKVWLKFHGTHYFVARGEDNWEVPYLGVFRFIAGTGKYKAIRGGGTYKGVASSTYGVKEELLCSAEY